MPPDYVARRAVSVLASGPTGGVMGAALAAGKAGVEDFIAVDMGGTSFDVCLVRDGQPEIKTDWNWRYRYYIGLPMVDVQSVGAGGGSIARVRQSALLVGPESAGSAPGPVCYGRGGTQPTVTDADAVLGYLPLDGFAGGRMTLDVDGARDAIQRDVAEPLGLDVVEAAWGIERIVNANMANATRRVLASHGADARELALIAYGGNGAVHAWAIATELGIDRILVPKAAPAFSALGVLVADYVVDLLRSYVVPLSQVDLTRVHTLMSELQDEARKELDPTGLAETQVEVGLYAQMCYPGQNFDMSVPVPEADVLDEPGLLDLTERFHDQHEADRGFCFRNQQPLLRGVRLVARGYTPKPERLAPLGAVREAKAARRRARRGTPGPSSSGSGFVDAPVYDGSLLGRRRRGARARTRRGAVHGGGPAAGRDGSPRRARQLRVHGLVASACVPVFFDPESYATVEAACERLIPPVSGHPGATALGVADYIDGLLGAFAVDPPRIWAGGPFSGRHGGEARFAKFLPLSRLEELAWRTRIEGSRGVPSARSTVRCGAGSRSYRDGLAAARRRLRRRSPATNRTARLDAADRSSGSLLYEHACEARYGDARVRRQPRRRRLAAIGFPGDVQPRGYTDDEVSRP